MIYVLTTAGLSCDAINADEKTAFEIAEEKEDPRTLQVMEQYEFR